MKKLYILLTLIMIANSVFAGTPTGLYKDYKLKVTAIVTVYDQNVAMIYFDSNHQCEGNRAYISALRADYDIAMSMLLMAYASKSSVSIDLTQPTPGATCNGNYSYIGYLCVGDEAGACSTGW